MNVSIVNDKPWFEFKEHETGWVGMPHMSVGVEEAVKASKEILKHYEPESLAVEKFNWKVKEEYVGLLNLFNDLSGGASVAEEYLYLNYSKRFGSYELNSNSEGDSFKTFFTEEEFRASKFRKVF
ncbi:hypothetical protein cd3_082 [Carnobacterium phage cd3]|uniref:Uncharacterized protein n=1 Tax=Carnobacterium phage cd2 TaxID=2849244 RepID=A0AAE7VIZ8_9CAUD|nr:hypothetical protein PQD68_gp082 [Carnobacterium phage cd2]QXP45208.1 hypothetical protein cd2_082 [Carnobacterium phage cd2]QXP45237.1 hypothetical protein cd3_082 [Carnobacterium phage cd3]